MINELGSWWDQFGDLRLTLVVGFIAVLAVVSVAYYLRSRRQTPEEPPRPAGDSLPLREHFRELRSRLLLSMLALLMGSAVCFYFYEEILTLLITPAR